MQQQQSEFCQPIFVLEPHEFFSQAFNVHQIYLFVLCVNVNKYVAIFFVVNDLDNNLSIIL